MNCENQGEVDRLWAILTDGGEESQCGWLKDRFGVSWQIVPNEFLEMMDGKDPAKSQNMMQAMLKMKKLDMGLLRRAYDAG